MAVGPALVVVTAVGAGLVGADLRRGPRGAGTAAATAAISIAKTTPSSSLAYPLLRVLGTGGGAFMRLLLDGSPRDGDRGAGRLSMSADGVSVSWPQLAVNYFRKSLETKIFQEFSKYWAKLNC